MKIYINLEVWQKLQSQCLGSLTKDVKKKMKSIGFKVEVYEVGACRASTAVSNTVIIFQKNKIVETIELGDPAQISS